MKIKRLYKTIQVNWIKMIFNPKILEKKKWKTAFPLQRMHPAVHVLTQQNSWIHSPSSVSMVVVSLSFGGSLSRRFSGPPAHPKTTVMRRNKRSANIEHLYFEHLTAIKSVDRHNKPFMRSVTREPIAACPRLAAGRGQWTHGADTFNQVVECPICLEPNFTFKELIKLASQQA